MARERRRPPPNPEPRPLDAPNPVDGLHVYVHVPFCRRKCAYCAFHSGPPSPDEVQHYVDALCAEARHWGQRLEHPRAATLYMGGGTPTLLPEYALDDIFAALHEAFELPATAETTVEANPDSVDRDFLKRLRGLGVNRLSLGVQSLDDAELALLGRPHDALQATRAIDAARIAGFHNLSLDLIWGLPDQSVAGWQRSLSRALDARPEHVSCYGLSLEPGTPLARRVATGELTLPADDVAARMYMLGARLLEERGLIQYEIANFARMGFASRHNMGYWQGSDYLGLGPAAVSTLNGQRWTNPAETHAYALAVAGGRLAGKGPDAETLDAQTRAREMVMLSLRTSAGLDLAAYRRATGENFLSGRKAVLRVLCSNGLARLENKRLKLTRRGMLVSDAILPRLMETPPNHGVDTGTRADKE